MKAVSLRVAVVAALLACVSALALTPVSAQQSAKAEWDGVYTDAQAARGAKVYQQHCVFCHGKDLAGGNLAPAAGGPAFVAKWQSRPLRELFGYVQARMPYHNPNTLTRQANADVVAYMLQYSKVSAGAKEFAGDLSLKGGDPKRGEAFFTEAQAERGRQAFNRNCGLCHTTNDAKLTQKQVDEAPLPSSFAAPFLGRIYYGKMLYPTVYHLYTKMQSMPAFGNESISNNTRADIIAHILERNGFPAGNTELKPDVELMGQMMLNEQGFEHIFNGKDFSNLKFVLGTRCGPEPGRCARTEPGDTLTVLPGGKMYCKCDLHGYWYYPKKLTNFTVRFQHKFIKPEGWVGDDDIYMGGGGWLLFIQDTNMAGFGKSIEVEGRVRDMGDIFFIGGKQGKFTYDNAAKSKAVKVWDWNDIEIVSKDGVVKSYVNGALMSTITEHDDYPAGFFGMQVEGSPTEWRNVRIRIE